MLEAGPSHIAPHDSSEAFPGVCWPPLEMDEFPGSSPRLLHGSYLRLFVDTGGRSMPGCTPELLQGISGSIIFSSGDS